VPVRLFRHKHNLKSFELAGDAGPQYIVGQDDSLSSATPDNESHIPLEFLEQFDWNVDIYRAFRQGNGVNRYALLGLFSFRHDRILSDIYNKAISRVSRLDNPFSMKRNLPLRRNS
jgi:hypothetical protein